MKLTENIHAFIVGAAHYYVSSKEGDEVVLRINYQKNTYIIKKGIGQLSRVFREEVSKVAQDLLDRKHGVNFAERSKVE